MPPEVVNREFELYRTADGGDYIEQFELLRSAAPISGVLSGSGLSHGGRCKEVTAALHIEVTAASNIKVIAAPNMKRH